MLSSALDTKNLPEMYSDGGVEGTKRSKSAQKTGFPLPDYLIHNCNTIVPGLSCLSQAVDVSRSMTNAARLLAVTPGFPLPTRT